MTPQERAEHKKEVRRRWANARHAANREADNERLRVWRAANKDKTNAIRRAAYHRNKNRLKSAPCKPRIGHELLPFEMPVEEFLAMKYRRMTT